MSAASTPAPRSGPIYGYRYSSFWPVFVFLVGSGTFALFQVFSLEDQLDELTRGIDQMDAQVSRAKYEKAKFYAIAGDVVRLSATDPNAEDVASHFRLHELQAQQPVLMSTTTPPLAPIATRPTAPAAETTNSPAPDATNAPPVTPTEAPPPPGPLPAPSANP
jgi:hypothetical protein